MSEDKIPSLLKSVRKKCLECSGDSRQEVKECPITSCALYPYRLGRNPNRKGRELTEEQKLAAKERLAKARARKSKNNEERLDS